MKMRKSTRLMQGTYTQVDNPTVPTQPTMRESGESRTYGYIRVSSREQNEARQVVALHDFGISDDCIFLDKQSGKDFTGRRIRG